MLEFKFRKESIVLSYQFFMFDEFVSIWKDDKSKDKTKANKMLYFIYLLCDIREGNSLRDVEDYKREEEALFAAYRSRTKVFTKSELSLLEPAIKLYTDLNMTPEEWLLFSFDNKAIEISNVVESAEPETVTNDENGVVSFVSNSKIITNALSKLSKIRSNREKIVASIKDETIDQKIRGKLTLSPLVLGLIKI